jgi:hypothetical protein
MKSIAPHRQRATLVAVLTALSAAPLFAQTPPRPAVQLQQRHFGLDTWPADLNGDGITDLVGADFNTDGRRDIAVLLAPGGIDVFLNRGGVGSGSRAAGRRFRTPIAPQQQVRGSPCRASARLLIRLPSSVSW